MGRTLRRRKDFLTCCLWEVLVPKLNERDKVRAILSKYLVGDGCFEWLGCRDKNMYGRISQLTYGTMYPHIFMYRTFIGPVPAGLELDHLCRNPGCGRPNHLDPVPHGENMRRSPLMGTRATTKKIWDQFREENPIFPCGHPRSGDNIRCRDRGGKGITQECRTCENRRSSQYYARTKKKPSSSS